MSKCVVRMEMPENCECCPMVHTADVQGYHWCAALEQEVEQGLSRPKECPILCELPEKHGRLVDEYALYRQIPLKVCLPCPFGEEKECKDCVIDKVMQAVEDAPTIVPADTAERSET